VDKESQEQEILIMETGKYKLDGHKVVLCENLNEWAKWYETADRDVAKTAITEEITVSTVFLSLDHNLGKGKPVLFETMIFGGLLDEDMERYGTWDEAEAGHKRWVEKVSRTLIPVNEFPKEQP